jgi:16S rRNA (cytidine1402-2'-O)-methyltransferase
MTQFLAKQTPGSLYVVATPIGNLGDVTQRALQVLSAVGVIAAEDTRHTGQLLKHFGIGTSLMSLHEHNEDRRAAEIIERLRDGHDVALVSDAGTPLISDPGFDVVRKVVEAGLRAIPVPGACAAITALSVAGLPTDRFVFEGFLPAKAAARRERLQALQSETRTLIFYESPHRVVGALRDLHDCFGERDAVVARELTKQFETLYYGAISQLVAQTTDVNMARGEIVILVAGAVEQASSVQLEAHQVLRTLLEELPASTAAKLTARLTGAKRAELYELAVKWSQKDSE